MWRLIVIGVVLTAITASIGGFFLYQKKLIDGLNATIKTQREQIAGLEIDKSKLQASNESITRELDQKTSEARAAYAEIDRLRKADAASQERLTQLDRQINDRKRVERIEAIRRSKKAGLLLKIMNADVECEIVHFNRVDGKCVRGRFVSDVKQ